MAPWSDPATQAYSRLLADSFARTTGRPLAPAAPADAAGLARALFDLPQPLVSHGTGADPVFRYGNAAALALWELDWPAFTRLPSRRSAEADPAIQADRSRLLAAALARGAVTDYEGIRISSTGRRFRIAQTVLWTVTDPAGQVQGQAALIGRVTPLG